jgi:hypothetical protein
MQGEHNVKFVAGRFVTFGADTSFSFICYETLLCAKIQQNSVNPAHTGPDTCRSIEYSGLSDHSYTSLSSYR